MALTDLNGSTSTTMLVQPAGNCYGGGNNGGLFGGTNNDWLGILFLIALCNGGWGGFGGFGGSYGASGAQDGYILASDFSQLNKAVTDSYSMTERKLDGITNGLCDGFYTQAQLVNGVNANVANAQYNLANAITQNGYESRLATQTIGSQLSACCCDIREAIGGVNYNAAANTNAITQAVTSGFCAENYNNSNNTRDIIQSTHNDTDRIIARLDAMETARQAEKIAELQSENQGLKFAASQQAQNAYLISQLGTKCPQPAYVVQPPEPVNFPRGCGCCNG